MKRDANRSWMVRVVMAALIVWGGTACSEDESSTSAEPAGAGSGVSVDGGTIAEDALPRDQVACIDPAEVSQAAGVEMAVQEPVLEMHVCVWSNESGDIASDEWQNLTVAVLDPSRVDVTFRDREIRESLDGRTIIEDPRLGPDGFAAEYGGSSCDVVVARGMAMRVETFELDDSVDHCAIAIPLMAATAAASGVTLEP